MAKYLKRFSSVSDANAQGASGLDSPHVSVVQNYSAVNFYVDEDDDIFNCEFDSNGKIVPSRIFRCYVDTTDTAYPNAINFYGNGDQAPATVVLHIYNSGQEIDNPMDLSGSKLYSGSTWYEYGFLYFDGFPTVNCTMYMYQDDQMIDISQYFTPDVYYSVTAVSSEMASVPGTKCELTSFNKIRVDDEKVPFSAFTVGEETEMGFGKYLTYTFSERGSHCVDFYTKSNMSWDNNFGFNICSVYSPENALNYNYREIVIPNDITELPSDTTFANMLITAATIPDSVVNMGMGPFYNCNALKTLTIGDAVTTAINNFTLLNCSGLTSLSLGNSIPNLDASLSGLTSLENISIGHSVSGIPDNTFISLKNLSEVNLGMSVGTIGKASFSGCTSLETINLPLSLTGIGASAFTECSGLKSIDIPNSVTEMGNCLFEGCTGLTSIHLPNSITGVGDYSFLRCKSLTGVTLPETLTYIGTQAFSNCTGLTSIRIPLSVNMFGYSAFADCSNLTSLNIPNGVVLIPMFMCAGCSSLSTITIPASVTILKARAFIDCSGLTSITCLCTEPPYIEEGVFTGSTCPIYVPLSSVETYKARSGWSTYADRIRSFQ